MSNILQITIEDETFNIPRASAVKQKELLTIVGSLTAAATSQTGAEIDTDVLVGLLMRVNGETLTKLENILVNQCMLNGTTTGVITIDHFSNRILSYFRLIAEALKANLQDFFTYLDGINEQRRREIKLIQSRPI